MRLGWFALALAVAAFPPATARAQAPAQGLRAAEAMDARLRPLATAGAERPARVAVDDDYNWGSGWIGAAVGAGAGVVLGYALRSHTDTREEAPGLPVTLGVLGAIVGFFTGLAIGN